MGVKALRPLLRTLGIRSMPTRTDNLEVKLSGVLVRTVLLIAKSHEKISGLRAQGAEAKRKTQHSTLEMVLWLKRNSLLDIE
jgi:hypothetical protein